MNKQHIERNIHTIHNAMMKAMTELDIEYIELMQRLGCKSFRMYCI